MRAAISAPQWGEVPTVIEEENWYFKLSEHTAWLKSFIEGNPDISSPRLSAKAELLNALERSVGTDLCISRPEERNCAGASNCPSMRISSPTSGSTR